MEVKSRMTIDAAAVVIFLRPAAMAEQRAEAGGWWSLLLRSEVEHDGGQGLKAGSSESSEDLS